MREITFKHKNFKPLIVLALIFAIFLFVVSLILISDVNSINKKTLDDTELFNGTLDYIEEKGSDDPYYIFRVKESGEVYRISNLYNKLQSEGKSFKDIAPDSAIEFRVLNSDLNDNGENRNIISLAVNGTEYFSFEEGKSVLANNSFIGVIGTGIFAVVCLAAFIFLKKYNKNCPKTVALKQSFIAQSALRNRINTPYQKKGLIIGFCYLPVMLISAAMIFLGVGIFADQSYSLLLIIAGLSILIASTAVNIALSLKLRKKSVSFFCGLYDFKIYRDYSIKDNVYYDLSTITVLKFEESGLKMSLPKHEDYLKYIRLVTGKDPTAGMLRKMEVPPPEPFEAEKEIFLPYSDLDLFAQATYKNAGDLFTLCLVIQPKKTGENLKKLIELLFVIENEEQTESLMTELKEEELPFYFTYIDENLYNIIKKLNLSVDALDEILINRKKLIKENIRKQPIFTKLGKVIENKPEAGVAQKE